MSLLNNIIVMFFACVIAAPNALTAMQEEDRSVVEVRTITGCVSRGAGSDGDIRYLQGLWRVVRGYERLLIPQETKMILDECDFSRDELIRVEQFRNLGLLAWAAVQRQMDTSDGSAAGLETSVDDKAQDLRLSAYCINGRILQLLDTNFGENRECGQYPLGDIVEVDDSGNTMSVRENRKISGYTGDYSQSDIVLIRCGADRTTNVLAAREAYREYWKKTETCMKKNETKSLYGCARCTKSTDVYLSGLWEYIEWSPVAGREKTLRHVSIYQDSCLVVLLDNPFIPGVDGYHYKYPQVRMMCENADSIETVYEPTGGFYNDRPRHHYPANGQEYEFIKDNNTIRGRQLFTFDCAEVGEHGYFYESATWPYGTLTRVSP